VVEVYWGEFLVSPIPLELSFDRCTYNCTFCFSLLNGLESQPFDVPALMRLLSDYRNRESLQAKLLQLGYPVVVSNRSDPFTPSNSQISLNVLRVMAEMGIPVALQTKGGKGAFEALDFLPPSVWYISISMLDDELRKKIEPGAPSVEDRFGLLQECAQRGHRTVVGFNPCVPEWQPDPYPLLERIKDVGVEGVWIECLHFNYRQINNMTPKQREAIGENIIARARARRTREEEWNALERTWEAADKLGIPTFSMGQPRRSSFWDVFRDVYPTTFPTMQDYINLCYDEYGLSGNEGESEGKEASKRDRKSVV